MSDHRLLSLRLFVARCQMSLTLDPLTLVPLRLALLTFALLLFLIHYPKHHLLHYYLLPLRAKLLLDPQ